MASTQDKAGTTSGREIELKFEVAASDLPKLRNLLGDLPGAVEPAEMQRLASTYFDTDELVLRSRNIGLRVREKGGRTVQTIKTEDGSGSLARGEWEEPIEGSVPDLTRGTPPALTRGLGAKKLQKGLHPVFTTVVERRLQTLRRDGSLVEVALDEGRVEALDRQSPLIELELELKEGEPKSLFDLARELIGKVPLRVGGLSKADRGYLLLAHGAGSSKAEAASLKPRMRSDAAFRAIILSCLRHFSHNEALLLESRGSEALHQARVAIRRLRSALSLFKAMIADEELDRLKEELRWLGILLGEARNRDVFLARHAEKLEEGPEDGPLVKLGAALKREREEAYDAVEQALHSERVSRMMLDLLEWLDEGPWTRQNEEQRARPIGETAPELLSKFRRRVRKRGRKLQALSAAERHDVRIQAKKLRYATEFFAPPVFKGAKAEKRHGLFLGALKELQDHLGDLNDLETGRTLLHDAAGGASKRAVQDLAFVAGRLSSEDETVEHDLLQRAAQARKALVDVQPFWS